MTSAVCRNEFLNPAHYVAGVFTLPPHHSSPYASPYILNFKNRIPPSRERATPEAFEGTETYGSNACEGEDCVSLPLPPLSPGQWEGEEFFDAPEDPAPPPPTLQDVVKIEPWEDFNQRLVVARMVSLAIARGVARAEKEDELQNKKKEIARLKDKVHYYELVNHEMSQRNQEAIEVAQRHKRTYRKRRCLVLRCLGMGLLVGTTAVLVYNIFPWHESESWRMTEGLSPNSQPIQHNSTSLAPF